MTHLSEEQRLMQQTCRQYVDEIVIPFIRQNWQREWLMTPEDRLPPEILAGADKIGIRTLAVPARISGGSRSSGVISHSRCQFWRTNGMTTSSTYARQVSFIS